ncbi:hypothetical protein GCM10027318_11590 [Massilia agilis]
MAGQLELAQHMDLQWAEAAAEGDLLLRRDVLVAEHQHMVVEVGTVDAREFFVGERRVQVQAEHLGAERRIEAADRDRRVR